MEERYHHEDLGPFNNSLALSYLLIIHTAPSLISHMQRKNQIYIASMVTREVYNFFNFGVYASFLSHELSYC